MIILIVLSILLGSCGDAELSSTWLAGVPPVIDGRLDRSETHDEWRGALHFLEDEHMHIGLLNDERALYLCLATRNRDTQMKMLMQGFTLWFDAEGGKEKVFGLRFPAGARRSSGTKNLEGNRSDQGGSVPYSSRPSGSGVQGGVRAARPEPPRLSEFMDRLESRPEAIDIMISENASQWMTLAELKDLEFAIGEDRGVFNYELKLPLGLPGGNAFAFDAAPGDLLGIGFETEAPEIPDAAGRGGGMIGGMGGGRGGGMSGGMDGGMGGRGGGMDGGMGGRGGGMDGGMGGRGGGRSAMSEPLNFWGRIRLALPRETTPADSVSDGVEEAASQP